MEQLQLLLLLPLIAVLTAWPWQSKREICSRFMSEQIDTQTAARKLGIKRNPEARTSNLNGDVFVFCHYYLN